MRLLKGRSTLPYREAPLRPLKDTLLGDREELLYAQCLLRPCKPCHVHLLPAGCTSRLPASLDLSWSLLAVHAGKAGKDCDALLIVKSF